MATLETTFAGLKLKNPIIISSSGPVSYTHLTLPTIGG